MKHNQVYVRAKVLIEKRSGMEPVYRWVNCDVFDLDQKSFNAFVADKLFSEGKFKKIKDEMIPEEKDIEYFVADEYRMKYILELEK